MTSKAAVIALITTVVCAATSSAVELVAGFAAKDPVVKSDVNRGVVELIKGDVAGARAHFDEAIRLEPTMWAAYYDRAVIFSQQQRFDLALQDLNAAMRLKPTFLRTALLRASTNHQLHRYREALTELDHLILTIRLRDQTAAEAYNDRAWLRATCPDASIRDGQSAVKDATAACKISKWKIPWYVDTLAASYAELGDFDAAVRYEQQAAALVNPKTGSRAVASDAVTGIETRIELYKQGCPFRD